MSLIQEQILQGLRSQVVKKREDQILERLSGLGHSFKNEQEKADFAKKRLSLRVYEDKPEYRELVLDNNILVATWWETTNIEWNGNEVTITSGKH